MDHEDAKHMDQPTLDRYKRILARAENVLGNRDNAMEWLRSRPIALGGAMPLDLLETEEGAQKVEDLLGRIEHGVVS